MEETESLILGRLRRACDRVWRRVNSKGEGGTTAQVGYRGLRFKEFPAFLREMWCTW